MLPEKSPLNDPAIVLTLLVRHLGGKVTIPASFIKNLKGDDFTGVALNSDPVEGITLETMSRATIAMREVEGARELVAMLSKAGMLGPDSVAKLTSTIDKMEASVKTADQLGEDIEGAAAEFEKFVAKLRTAREFNQPGG